MDAPPRIRTLRGVIAVLFAGLLVLVLADSARAQAGAGSVEVKRVSGQVEVLKKGQSQWAPLAVGTRLVEGDDIRAHPGASAELAVPDGSTLFLAENSRLVMSKLEFDDQEKIRNAAFYLAVGKVRALVAKASISLLRSRQSNFVITTPTAVAAVRGTHYEVNYNAAEKKTRVAVLPDAPRPPEAKAHPVPVHATESARGDGG
jgi:hypothetical protein